MSVPDFQTLMLPSLKALSDGAERPISDVRTRVATSESLSDEDLREMIPSGRQPVFTNRISWAVIHMERAGLVERVGRAVYRLTKEGQRLLRQSPERIDMKVLRRYPEYVAWRSVSATRKASNLEAKSNDSEETPEEALEWAEKEIRKQLEHDVLERILGANPVFLEYVIIKLLIAMGYGGGDEEMGQVTGRSGDDGIDGIIREDALGLDEVYVQAKKYAAGKTVGGSELRNFAGAIDTAGTNKGVFVTTASFTAAARRYVELSPKRIILIDGEELARLMVKNNVGVRAAKCYEVKRIDEDFFIQE